MIHTLIPRATWKKPAAIGLVTFGTALAVSLAAYAAAPAKPSRSAPADSTKRTQAKAPAKAVAKAKATAKPPAKAPAKRRTEVAKVDSAGTAPADRLTERVPPQVLAGRPEADPYVNMLEAVPFSSEGAGISVRPPKGCVRVAKPPGSDATAVAEFVNRDKRWTLKVNKAVLTEPTPLGPVTDRKKQPHPGLLATTVKNLQTALPGSEVLRQEIGTLGLAFGDVGLLAIRYPKGVEGTRWLSQQAIISGDTLGKTFYLIALTTPSGDAKPTKPGAVNAAEAKAADLFSAVLDSIKLMDRAALRREQDQRLFSTRHLLVNLTPARLQTALVPEQWIRLLRVDRKTGVARDIGYSFIIEQMAAGIPRPLTKAERKAGKTRPTVRGGDGVLVAIRSWTKPAPDTELDAEAWLYVTDSLRHEDWSKLTVARRRKQPGEQSAAAAARDPVLGPVEAKRAKEKETGPAGGGDPSVEETYTTEFGSSHRRRVRGDEDAYTLSVTHVSKSDDPTPVWRQLPPWHMPHAAAHLLPRLLPLNEPKSFLFSVYSGDQKEVVLRYVDVEEEAVVQFGGRRVRAVPVRDRLGIEGPVTTHYLTPDGVYLGSENKLSGIIALPTDEMTLRRVWKKSTLAMPRGLDPARDGASDADDEGEDEEAAATPPARRTGTAPRGPRRSDEERIDARRPHDWMTDEDEEPAAKPARRGGTNKTSK